MEIALDSDVLNPEDLDWTAVPDAVVFYAARDGIPQAVAEAARRNGWAN